MTEVGLLSGDNWINQVDYYLELGMVNWIIEARVWDDGEGVGELVEEVQFHVHP